MRLWKMAAILALPVVAGQAAEQALPAGKTPLPRTPDEVARIERVTALPESYQAAQPFEANSGGAGTVREPGAGAFSHAAANLPEHRALDFELGRALFQKLWVASPSSTKASDGLGPRFNARACQSCHIGDGRGRVFDAEGEVSPSFMLKLGRVLPDGSIGPDPLLGHQLQPRASHGMPPEGAPVVSYTEEPVELAGGEVVSLRRPAYGIAGAELDPATKLSARIAPQMIGLGLLEAIPEAEILALADPDDADGDGISGRPHQVIDLHGGETRLGRFGHKAAMPSVRQQSASAFSTDLGISTPLYPAPWGDCTKAQDLCRAQPHGDGDVRGFEIDDVGLDLVTLYAANLAVPARRDVEAPQVLRGKEMFYTAGCVACHRPAHVTARDADGSATSFQLIWPYTDLLLHDMGEGLAAGIGEGTATAAEWRTPPLWGIGLTAAVNGSTNYLHDGRARSLTEAILWHGGEAFAAREAFRLMPPSDRAALIDFLESL